jgi:uncharacterized membrane protein
MVEASRGVAKRDVKSARGRIFCNILALLFMVVGLQLNCPSAHAGADGFIVIDVPGSTCLPAFGNIFPVSELGNFFGPCTSVNAMNPSKVVTGTYQDDIGAFHGYVQYPDGSFTKFDVPGATCASGSIAGLCTYPAGINPSGAISGYWYQQASCKYGTCEYFHGFLRTPDGTITSFDVPSGVGSTYAGAINPEGAITGWYGSLQCPNPPIYDCGFLRAPDGTFTSFSPPSGSYSINPIAINPNGTIIGWYTDVVPPHGDPGATHGFVRTRDGTFTSFDAPGANTFPFQGTLPYGITPEGTITGYYFDVNVVSHGFLRTRDGTITSFDYPGTTGGTSALAINPEGTITGSYLNAAGAFPGFVRNRDGTFTSFFPPNSNSFGPTPTAIIPSGGIAGFFTDTSNLGHGFLLMR